MKLTYYGAACWLIESREGRFLVDPGCLFGDGLSVQAARALPELTAVLVTHFDPDHVNRLRHVRGPVIVPGDEPPPGITPLAAKHGLRPWVRHTAYLFDLEGQRLLHMGDSPRLVQWVAADLALVNVSGIACNVAAAVTLGERVGARTLIPMHHFQTPLTRRRGQLLVQRSDRPVVEIRPGASWTPPPIDAQAGSGRP